MSQLKNLNDPFLSEFINPIFLSAVKDFWQKLTEAEDVKNQQTNEIDAAKYNLVKLVFRKAFQKLYYKYKLEDISGDLFILSAIHSDGIGDFMQLLNVAKLTRENFPQIKVYVVYTHKQNLPEINPEDYLLSADQIFAFQETEDANSVILSNVLDEKLSIDYEKELKRLLIEKQELTLEYNTLLKSHAGAANAIKTLIDDVDESILHYNYFVESVNKANTLYEKMQKSLAIVHIALAINTFDNDKLSDKSLYFAEAGNFQGIANYLQRNWFSLGFGAFDEGMLLKKTAHEKTLKDKQLSKLLFSKDEPQDSDYAAYAKHHTLHLAYLPRVAAQKDLYVQLIVEKYIHDPRDMDIILCKNSEIDPKILTHDWMSAKNISYLELTNLSNDERLIIENKDARKKKKLRLVLGLPLERQDFLKLMKYSGEIVGCTGDGSLSDCLAENKIPFYEIRPHKMQLIESLTHICLKQTLPEVLDYFNMLLQFSDFASLSYSQKILEIVNEGTFKLQWIDFLKFINKYYVFEESYVSHLNRHFFIQNNPSLKMDESLVAREYYESCNDFKYLYESFEKILKKIKNK